MKPTIEQICQRLRAIAGHFSPYFYGKQELTRSEKLEFEVGAAEAADLIEGLIPRPIEEAPKDGTWLLARCCKSPRDDVVNYEGRWFVTRCVIHVFEDWHMYPGMNVSHDWFDTFIPLSAIQKLLESGE